MIYKFTRNTLSLKFSQTMPHWWWPRAMCPQPICYQLLLCNTNILLHEYNLFSLYQSSPRSTSLTLPLLVPTIFSFKWKKPNFKFRKFTGYYVICHGREYLWGERGLRKNKKNKPKSKIATYTEIYFQIEGERREEEGSGTNQSHKVQVGTRTNHFGSWSQTWRGNRQKGRQNGKKSTVNGNLFLSQWFSYK